VDLASIAINQDIRNAGRVIMLDRSSATAVAVALAAALMATINGARADDDAKYPDWKGKWERFAVRGLPGQPSHDQTKPWGFGQQAPLTPGAISPPPWAALPACRT
jgi:uncharacterized protein (DUF2147 family)